MTKSFFPSIIATLALTCVAGRLDAADIGGMTPMLGPPTPPAAPTYMNAYFTLTWTWTGNGFDISGTVANADGGPGVTNTGSLSVMETWTLQPGATGQQWVRQGDVGWYRIGNTQTSKPGYLRWTSSTVTSVDVPSNQKKSTIISVNSQTAQTNGMQSSKIASISTWYANGLPSNIQGQLSTDDTLTDATSVTESKANTTYNGPPGQQDAVTVNSATTYTDATKTLLSSSDSTYHDVDTRLNPDGTVASAFTNTTTNTQDYATTVDARGAKNAVVLGSRLHVIELYFGYDANGKQISSSTIERSKGVTNLVYKPGGIVVQVRPLAMSAMADVSDHPQTGPAYTALLSRRTIFAAPADGSYPRSFDGGVNVNGALIDLQLSWDADHNLTGKVDVNGNLSMDGAKQEYDALYEIETDLMDMAPSPGEYPFYPWLVPGPVA